MTGLPSQWVEIVTIAALECPGGLQYEGCGTGESRQCSDPGQDSTSPFCVEGCYCPPGTALHQDHCVPVKDCPCFYNNKPFPTGSEVKQDCNHCVCQEAQWRCSTELCGKRCSAVGDPHYTTFDGHQYDFMGQCAYTMVKHQDFEIINENHQCDGFKPTEALRTHYEMNHPPTCTRAVIIKMNNQTVKLKQRKEVMFDGEEVTRLPALLDNGISVRVSSSLWVTASLPLGVTVWWDGASRAYYEVPGTLKGSVQGLCGTFSGDQWDDFTTPDGDVETSPTEFANQ